MYVHIENAKLSFYDKTISKFIDIRALILISFDDNFEITNKRCLNL